MQNVITTATSESSGTVYVKEYSNANVAMVVRGDKRCVLKAHGSVDTPGEMIFTREEYVSARFKYSSFYSLLDALAVTHTLLFIGCGVSDPDVQMMLERHAYSFPGSRPHYMVAPKSSFHHDVEMSLKRNMNLRFLFYKPHDHHAELRQSVHELVSLVETERESLASTRDW
ncbi:MAG: SIR2 family protein [Anaerolineales bacterium]